MSGGGKGGKNTEETVKDIPDWLKQPAIRNLQRAEDVQRIEYMPYRGAEIAAFNDVQNAAMNNNIATAKAFGLLDPNSTITAEGQMPTPTTFDGGWSGYSSMPLYDQALAETKAQQPGAIAQYEALFGAPAMAQLNAARNSGGGRFRGSANVNNDTTTPENRWVDKASHIMDVHDYEKTAGEAEARKDYLDAVDAGTNWDKARDWNTLPDADKWTTNAKKHTDTQGTIMSWPQKPKIVTKKGSNPLGYGNPHSSGGLTSRLDSKGATPTPVSRPIDEIVAGYRSKK